MIAKYRRNKKEVAMKKLTGFVVPAITLAAKAEAKCIPELAVVLGLLILLVLMIL